MTKPYKYCCYYEDCAKIYKTKFNLRRHINSYHLQIRSYICTECTKSFVSKQNMKEHEFSHTGERPFKCPEPDCNKIFRQSSQLSIHKRIHKPFTSRNIQKGCLIDMRLTDYWRDNIKQTEVINILDRDKNVLPLIRSEEILSCSSKKLPVLPLLLEHLKRF